MYSQARPARILIADDHEVVRRGLRDMIDNGGDLKVVGEAANGYDAENLAYKQRSDLLVLDITMPQKSGLEVMQSLRSSGLTIPILLFSMHPYAQYADFAQRNGAQGFVSKGDDGVRLLRAIRTLLDGGTWFPWQTDRSSIPSDPFTTLSRREIEVMVGLLRGESLEAIGKALGVAAKTVSTYRRRLLDKLDLNSNAELALLAAKHPAYYFRMSSSPDRQATR